MNCCCEQLVAYLSAERASRIKTYLPKPGNIYACRRHEPNVCWLTNLLVGDLENV